MAPRLSPNLIEEQRAVDAEIREAFKGVTREGGISWTEAEVIDGYGSDEARAEARASEKERSWEELIDLPDWSLFMSNWSFLDAIGFRYYIAPAMIHNLQHGLDGMGEAMCYALTIDSAYRQSMIALLTSKQSAAVARFLRFMIAAVSDDIDRETWDRAYKSHWDRCADVPTTKS
jgi:hypothetical protein